MERHVRKPAAPPSSDIPREPFLPRAKAHTKAGCLSRGCLPGPWVCAPALGCSGPHFSCGWFQAGFLSHGSSLKQSLGLLSAYQKGNKGTPQTGSNTCYPLTNPWEKRYTFKMISDIHFLGILIKFLENVWKPRPYLFPILKPWRPFQFKNEHL